MGCLLSSIGVGICHFCGSHSVTLIIIGIGLIQGFGIGLTYVQNNHVINQYFVKYRGTANGIGLSGGTIGAFIMSYVLEFSLNHFQFEDSFLILSGIILFTLPFCLLLKPFKEKEVESIEKGNQNPGFDHFYISNISQDGDGIPALQSYNKIKDDAPRLSVIPINPLPLNASSESIATSVSTKDDWIVFRSIYCMMKNKMFLLIALTHMAYFWSSITYCMIVVDFALDRHISVTQGVDLITAFSVGDLIGRLGSGVAFDKKIMPLKYIALISSSGIGLFMLIAIYVDGYVAFIIISSLLGFLSGVINVLLNQLFCKYLGAEKAALAFGISAFISGIGTIARPVVVGTFRDQTNGSYDGLFITLGVASFVTGLLWLLEPLLNREREEISQPLHPSIKPVIN